MVLASNSEHRLVKKVKPSFCRILGGSNTGIPTGLPWKVSLRRRRCRPTSAPPTLCSSRAWRMVCRLSCWRRQPVNGRCVETTSGGIPALVQDGETGLVLAAGDVPAWRDALVALAGRADVVRQMGAGTPAYGDALRSRSLHASDAWPLPRCPRR